MRKEIIEKTNALSHETSPYLLQHATNPVNWYPWNEDILQRAKQENKPILLSIAHIQIASMGTKQEVLCALIHIEII